CLKIEDRAADILERRTHNLAAAIDTQMKFLVVQPSSPIMLRRALRRVKRILAVKMAIASDDPNPPAAELPEKGSEASADTSTTKNAAAVFPPPRDNKADAAAVAEDKAGPDAPPAKDEKPSTFLRLL
ncbi:hypothetical protein LTR16_004911, partial [Cryomyces antarcticus]